MIAENPIEILTAYHPRIVRYRHKNVLRVRNKWREADNEKFTKCIIHYCYGGKVRKRDEGPRRGNKKFMQVFVGKTSREDTSSETEIWDEA
jgi:hypothetical protein